MKKKEDFLKMTRDSGTINLSSEILSLTTGVKSISYDTEIKHMKEYFSLSGTRLLRTYFIKKFNLKNERELEKFIWEKLLIEAKVGKNFSEDFRKIINEHFMDLCEEQLKKEKNINMKKQLKIWIKRKKEYLKNEEYKRGKYGEI